MSVKMEQSRSDTITRTLPRYTNNKGRQLRLPTNLKHMSQQEINKANQSLYAVCDCEDAIDAIQRIQDRPDIADATWDKLSDVKYELYNVLEELKTESVLVLLSGEMTK